MTPPTAYPAIVSVSVLCMFGTAGYPEVYAASIAPSAKQEWLSHPQCDRTKALSRAPHPDPMLYSHN